MSEKTEIPYKDIVFKDKNCLWFCGKFILMESFFSTFKLTVQNSMSLALTVAEDENNLKIEYIEICKNINNIIHAFFKYFLISDIIYF